MNEKKLTPDFIKQSLVDAGCDCHTIDCILECCEAGNTNKTNQILSKHRKKLLDEVHKGYKCIDCLDYLSYQMEKEEKEKQ